jgi:hypothetical protein
MSDKIDSHYVESYSKLFAEKVSGEYFGTKKYMDGQEIIRLTPSNQVNLMVIKTIFVAWQEEMEKLKRNPYFNYRDLAVKEVLKDLMNVLSRAIRIEREDFEPILQAAVRDTILLAADPVTFFDKEISLANTNQSGNYLKESKRYIKWHSLLLNILVEKSSSGASSGELKRALGANYDFKKDQLKSAASLLEPLGQVHPLNFEELFIEESAPVPEEKEVPAPVEVRAEEGEKSKPKFMDQPQHRAAEGSKAIDPALAWAKFESEQYSYMKGSVGDLTEHVGINQRFMFTKVLFEGNHDLMMHALKSVDESDNFVEAIEMLNQRYVAELNWDIDSEEVGEFLQLIFRKFDHKA